MLNIVINIKPSKMIKAKQSAFIHLPYNIEALAKVKTIPGRKWIAEEKSWEINEEYLPMVSQLFKSDKVNIRRSKIEVGIPEEYEFKSEPLPHQKEGIIYGLNHNRFILRDEQGLGKTYQSLHIAAIRKYLYMDTYTLIICGINGLKQNWLHEVELHTNEKGFILGSRYTKKGKLKPIKSSDKLDDIRNIKKRDEYFIITNVESFQKVEFAEEVQKLCRDKVIKTILFDEVHQCKNPSNTATKNILTIEADNYICMSGTPMINNPLDMYVPLSLIGVEQQNYFHFKNHFCIYKTIIPKKQNRKVKILIGFQNLEEIQQKIQNHSLRRTKELLHLPDKIHIEERLEMLPEQKKLYQNISQNILQDTTIESVDNALAKITRLRQVTGNPNIVSNKAMDGIKIQRMKQIVEENIENNRKIIIFSIWNEMAQAAEQALKKYHPLLITGDTKNRFDVVQEFQTKKDKQVIIGTIKALGTGYTLTAADTVIFLDSPWTMADKMQAEDRAHRIGTKHSVTYITLICAETVDERVETIIKQKKDLNELVMEFTSVGKFVKYMLEGNEGKEKGIVEENARKHPRRQLLKIKKKVY